VVQYFFLILLFVPVGALFAENPASELETLTLERALALSWESNHAVKRAELEVAKHEDRLAAARTRRLPSFEFNAFGAMLLQPIDFRFNQGAFGTLPSGSPNPATDVTITTPRRFTPFVFAAVDQPISQLYRIRLGIQAKEVGHELAKEKLRAQKQSLGNELKRVYFSILKTQSALEATEESIKLYRELDRVTEEYVLRQSALKSEGLEVKTRLAKAEFEILSLQNVMSSQQERLNQLIGRPITSKFRVSPMPEMTPFELDLVAAQARALEQRPESREARLRQKQAGLDRRIKKAEFIPDLSLSYRYISPFNVELVPKNVSAAGLYLTWEPFDWGRKRRELAEMVKVEQQAVHGVEESEALVLLDVNSRFRRLQETRALLRLSQLTQETEREKLRVVSSRYAEKAALLHEVLQAQTALTQAHQQYSQTLADFWTARADFARALGEDE
jgi:outer membrane protein TolC